MPKAKQTHCRNGHPFDEANTYIDPRGRRSCRPCSNDTHKRYRKTRPRVRSPEKNSWRAIMDRCHTPTNAKYPRYGGRGITVCARWRHSFDAFLADMGPKPSSEHTVDRIDNDGNYEPGNCRWATPTEQSRNRGVSRLITALGATRSLVEWSELTGIRAGTIYWRLKDGWTADEAMTRPVRKYPVEALE